MKQTLTFFDFLAAFDKMGRRDNFSYDGLRVLYDFFEQYDDDCGTDTELDVIAICCEFSESTPDEIRDNYSLVFRGSKLLEYLNYNTMVCGETSNTIIYADF